jgi:hypothetical protein
MDASCSQVPQDVHREFHELGLLETAKNKKKQHENQFTELKSSSESIKVIMTVVAISATKQPCTNKFHQKKFIISVVGFY